MDSALMAMEAAAVCRDVDAGASGDATPTETSQAFIVRFSLCYARAS